MAVARSETSSNHSSILIGLGGILLLFLARHLFARIQEERKIRSLGAHAKTINSWVPFGLGFVARTVRDQYRHDLLAGWYTTFADRSAVHPFTREIRTVGTRLVLTADEENIKAILATQFHDYGKGAQFNSEWHDFLGDSIFTTDGEQWHASRQLIRPQFIKDRVSDLAVF
ncbi:putative cytochrome 52A4, partial [Aureobasidium melanogenum]